MRFNNIRLTGGTDEFTFWLEGVAVSEATAILKAVDGLGPTEVDVSIANTLYQGGVFQNRRPQNREIVMRIGLSPNYSADERASDIRELFYQLMTPFTPSKAMTVHIYLDDDEQMNADGYIKKFEIVPFSKDTEIQITIACPQPYFKSTEDVILSGTDIFSFVFPTITNAGTAPVGFQLRLKFTDDIDSWGIRNVDTEEILEVTPTGTGPMVHFWEDDFLWIDTRAGHRSVDYYSYSDGLINIVGQMSDESTWPLLNMGVNHFEVLAAGSSFVWDSFLYRPEYVGV